MNNSAKNRFEEVDNRSEGSGMNRNMFKKAQQYEKLTEENTKDVISAANNYNDDSVSRKKRLDDNEQNKEDDGKISEKGSTANSKASEQLKEIQLIAEQEFQNNFEQTVIYSLFFLVFFSVIMINVDHGTLPGSTKEIEDKLSINNFGFGVLGSVVYGGLTFGSAMATMLFNRGEWIKPLLASSLFINSICLYLFTVSDNFLISCILRGLTGVM